MIKKLYVLFFLYCFALILVATQCTGLRPNPQLTDRGGTHSEPPPRSRYPLNTQVATNGEFEDAMWTEIEKYLGVPYRWGGTSRYGMDCSGFVLTVYRDAAGLKLPRKVRDMFRRGEVVSHAHLTFGDLVFFEKIESSGVSHVGIYLEDGEFVHASTSSGVVVSSLGEEYYRERFVGGRRVTPSLPQ